MKPHKQVLGDEELAQLDGVNAYGKIQLTEVSALTARGIVDVFDWITQTVVEGSQSEDQGADGGA